MKSFKLILTTPERKVLDKEIVQATLPVVDGEVTILADHIAYVATLKPGEIRLVDGEGKEEHIAISSGFLEFANNTLTLLADTAERAEELDLARAEVAVKRAEEAKARKDLGEMEYAAVAAQLEKELARLRVARKRR
jgi:F-type H+-transporting ATPase subunit epsilon